MTRSGQRRFAVTHAHSLQSSNRASPMDALVRAAVERVTGESAEAFDWSESLTTADQLAALLVPTDERSRIDLLFVTDHVNETTRAFHPTLVELAAREPRVALGAEIQTVVERPPGEGACGTDRRWAIAPEVLVYGGPDRVRAGSGWRFGLDEPLLSELQAVCTPAGAPRAEIHRLLAACRERGLAHALAHPLDGHLLDLETTLALLAACRFPEVVNGGFSGESSRRLRRFVVWHNRQAAPRDLLVPWGGSDAHLGDYARVRMAWDPPQHGGGMADFLRDMVSTPPRDLLQDEVFAIVGRPQRLSRCLGEVLRLLAKNAGNNRATFRGPRRLARLAWIGTTLAVRRVLELRAAQERLGAALDRHLDALEALQPRPAGADAELVASLPKGAAVPQ